MVLSRSIGMATLAAIFLLWADTAYGAWYGGGGLSLINRKIPLGAPYNKTVGVTRSGVGVKLGWLAHRNLGVEFDYQDLGSVSSEETVACPPGFVCATVLGSRVQYDVSINAYSLYLVPRVPVNERWALCAKVGMSYCDVGSSGVAVHRDGSAFSYGGRVEWVIKGSLSLLLEYARPSPDMRGVVAGLIYRPE